MSKHQSERLANLQEYLRNRNRTENDDQTDNDEEAYGRRLEKSFQHLQDQVEQAETDVREVLHSLKRLPYVVLMLGQAARPISNIYRSTLSRCFLQDKAI